MLSGWAVYHHLQAPPPIIFLVASVRLNTMSLQVPITEREHETAQLLHGRDDGQPHQTIACDVDSGCQRPCMRNMILKDLMLTAISKIQGDADNRLVERQSTDNTAAQNPFARPSMQRHSKDPKSAPMLSTEKRACTTCLCFSRSAP